MKPLSAVVAVPTLALAVLLAGCGSEPSDGDEDSGRDSGRDRGRDSGRDSSGGDSTAEATAPTADTADTAYAAFRDSVLDDAAAFDAVAIEHDRGEGGLENVNVLFVEADGAWRFFGMEPSN